VGRAKDIIVRPISAQDANRIVRAIHYSGKVVNNSQLHLGVFLDGKCGGAMQFGPSLDKRKMLGLVTGTLWNEFIELNRMAFADWLPRNSESRAIGYAFRWIRKTYPQIKWCVSFADGTQCGDGTIYRASGFALTGIKENTQIWAAPSGEKFSRMSLTDGRSKQEQQSARAVVSRSSMTMKGKNGGGRIREKFSEASGAKETGGASMRQFSDAGWEPLIGFQLRYIYFLDPTARARLTVPILPFSEIDRRGAGMYKGKQRIQSRAGGDTTDTPVFQTGEGGSTPTPALQSSE
jgi:hypothetical protein